MQLHLGAHVLPHADDETRTRQHGALVLFGFGQGAVADRLHRHLVRFTVGKVSKTVLEFSFYKFC